MKTRKLNRDSNARFALFRGLAASLLDKEEVKTTAAKARTVRTIVEKMISKAKTGTVHARRLVQSDIQDNLLVAKLFADIAPRFKGVNGGYTKITVIGTRKGDNAPIVKLALTKKKEVVASAKTAKSGDKAEKAKVATAVKTTAGSPKIAKPTRTAKMGVNKAGMIRKTGER
jgi:large subunit ribosomal protein L17